MGLDDFCNIGLDLGLGFTSPTDNHRPSKLGKTTMSSFEPSLTLGLCRETYSQIVAGSELNNKGSNESGELLYRQDSGAESFSNGSVKREREAGSEEGEIERVSSRVSDEDDDGANARKKLRLNKDQSALLEESFKIHSTLNPVLSLIFLFWL